MIEQNDEIPKGGGVWGFTKRDWDRFDPSKKEDENNPKPHYFEGRVTICIPNAKNSKRRGRLFMPRPKFDPAKPECGKACPECLKILEMRKLDERSREMGKCRV